MFPVASVYELAGPTLQNSIEKFLEKEKRSDLKVFGSAFAHSLKKRESFWSVPIKLKVRAALYTPLHVSCKIRACLLHHQRSLPQLEHLHLPKGRGTTPFPLRLVQTLVELLMPLWPQYRPRLGHNSRKQMELRRPPRIRVPQRRR